MKINYKGHIVEGTVEEIKELLNCREKRASTRKHKLKRTKVQRKNMSAAAKKRWRKQ